MYAFYAALALAVVMAVSGHLGAVRANPLDWSLLALVGAFILSAFGAVAPRAAVQFLITQLTFLSLYWALSRLGRQPDYRRWIIEILAFAPLLLALIGLGAAVGWIKYPSAVEGNRISSSLQYYNSLAAYLTAGLVFALALRGRSGGEFQSEPLEAQSPAPVPVWRCFYYSLTAYFCLVATIFTYSRGGWLVLPPVLLIFLLLVPSGRRQKILLTGLAPVTGALLAAWIFEPGFKNQSEMRMVGGLLLGAGVTLVFDRLAVRIIRRSAGRERLVWAALAGIAAAGLILAAAMLPTGVVARIAEINFMDMSVQERLTFYRDALKIIKDFPVLGIGGGGWATVFMAYQSYGYYSTQVHSWLMQVWLEGGTLALAALLAAVGSFAAMFFRLKNRLWAAGNTREAFVLTGAAVGAGAIFLHSLIDFNLSLAGLTLFLTGLIALLRSYGGETQAADPGSSGGSAGSRRRGKSLPAAGPGPVELAVILTAIVATLANTSLLAGLRHGQAGLDHLKARNIAEARDEFTLAVKYDPLQATYWMDYGNTTMTVGNSRRDPNLVRDGWGYVQKALSLEPRDAKLRRSAGTGAISNGLVEEGLREMESALKANPHTAVRYEEMAQTLYLAGEWYLRKGQPEPARQKFEQALAIPPLMREKSGTARAPWAGRDQLLPPETEPLSLFAAKSLVMLGRTDEAETLLSTVKSPNLAAEATLWKALSLERQGRSPEAARLLREAANGRPDLQRAFEQISSLLKR